MMNKDITTKINEEELAATTGGATKPSNGAKYSEGDVVEVGFVLYSGWSNRGTIAHVRFDDDTWKYYVKFDDWFMPNGWIPESRIQSKVR